MPCFHLENGRNVFPSYKIFAANGIIIIHKTLNRDYEIGVLDYEDKIHQTVR